MEAAVQVLLSVGLDRFSTTRVAERAGVSVGTLYQYYPNKTSLLFAVLEQKMEDTAVALETACHESRGRPLSQMIRHVVERFVDAKMARADISTALYRVSADVGGPQLVRRVEARCHATLAEMLATASDGSREPDAFGVTIVFAAMSGAMRSVLETGASPSVVRKLREHLVLICESYSKALLNIR